MPNDLNDEFCFLVEKIYPDNSSLFELHNPTVLFRIGSRLAGDGMPAADSHGL